MSESSIVRFGFSLESTWNELDYYLLSGVDQQFFVVQKLELRKLVSYLPFAAVVVVVVVGFAVVAGFVVVVEVLEVILVVAVLVVEAELAVVAVVDVE